MVGSIRLAYFLCTAWREIPSPSATSNQLIPARSAASTCRNSNVSVPRLLRVD